MTVTHRDRWASILALPFLLLCACAHAADSGNASAGADDKGARIFSERGCAGCHGTDGRGGMGKKLASSRRLGDADYVIAQILHGGGAMPAFRDQLDDGEIAAVATYVRTHFGNDYESVDAGDASRLRKSSSAHLAAAPSLPKDTQAVGAAPTSVKQPSGNGPSQRELLRAGPAEDSWLMYNKGYDGSRFSTLKEINTRNAGRLRPVCAMQLGESTSFQSNVVVYRRTAYVTTQHSTFALDARSCRMLWKHTYDVQGPEPFDTNRGVAIADGRVFRGTTDGHVIALDARTGDLLWNARPVDSAVGYFLSGSPVVWENTLVIGTAGADWGAPGRIIALDTRNGSERWSVSVIVPSSFGSAEAAKVGGGSSWTSFAIDPLRKLVYAPIGNPAPDFIAEERPGANLYTNSILALDLETGRVSHHYQQIAADPLDRDTAAAPVLLQLDRGIGGRPSSTQYVAVANKAGHLFLYDDTRRSAQPLYRVEVTPRVNADTAPTEEGVHVCPGINGGVEWYGPSFDPYEEILYVGSVDWCTVFKRGEAVYSPGQMFFGGTYALDPVEKAKGWIKAVDARSGRILWSYRSDAPVVASVTPTAGGVLFTGELTGDFVVLDAEDGETLYRFYTGGPIAGGISTYRIDGRQYVAVPSGNMSRTWTPDTAPAATVFIFSLP